MLSITPIPHPGPGLPVHLLTACAHGVPLARPDRRRRVSLSEFKGKLYVGVREFYRKDGQLLHGKKGLNLSAEQWATLKEQADSLTQALASK